MLRDFFNQLLMVSLSGTILFFLILILKPLTKKVFSPYLNYCLLIITLLTFIIPYGVLIPKLHNSFVSIPDIIERKSIADVNRTTEIKENSAIHTNGKIDKDQKIQSTKPVKNEAGFEKPVIKDKVIKGLGYMEENLGIIWLLGSIVFIFSSLMEVISFKKNLKSGSRAAQNEDVKYLFYECCKNLGINKKIQLMVCESIGTPMATGIFNTVITIPTEEFDFKVLKMIFKHELMHYKRKDLWIKLMSFWVLALHWFNPVIYLVNKELNKACELSCDFQVVKDMSKEDKKYYGLAILKVIDNSLNRKITLGTAMSDSSKNQLKERLGMIKSGKRPKKLMTLLSITTAVILTVTGVFVSSALAQINENKNFNDFAVLVKDNGLWAVNLSNNNKEVLIDKGETFKDPSISPNGENVAYTKGQSLYVAPIDLKQGQNKAIKIDDNILGYVWGNNNDLVYSTEKGGLNGFNLKTKKSSLYVKSEEQYEYMVSDKKGNIYAEVYRNYTKDGDQYTEAKGLIRYNLDLARESLIIKSRPWNDETGDMGLCPRVAGISKDGNYVYIWRRVQSGSTNSDGAPLGVYDVKNNKFIPFNSDQVFALTYKDNLAINPLNGGMAVLNNGGARDMNINKTIGIIDAANVTSKTILPDNMISTDGQYGSIAKGIVTMTPSFSPDGKKVIYAASKANSDGQQWMKEPHNIYTVDIKTKKIEKITNGNNFDFAPKYILNGQGIVFARIIEDTVSLFELKGNKEECIAKGIKLDGYYGHYKLEQSLDIHIEGQ